MKNLISKVGIPMIIIFVVLIYFIYNVSQINGSLIFINYSVLFLIVVTWLISIIRTIKEKNKVIKILPCLIITLLAILSYFLEENLIYSEFYIELMGEIGIALFVYEIMDLFKIKLSKSSINIFSVVLGFIIISIFFMTQLTTIYKYRNSLNKIYGLFNSTSVTYDTFFSEYNTLVLDYPTFGDHSNKLFVTNTAMCKEVYGWAVDGINTTSLKNTKNNREFKQQKNDMYNYIERSLKQANYVFKEAVKRILSTMIIAISEFLIVISV